MKRSCLIMAVVLFPFLLSNAIQAHEAGAKLNQIELDRQFIGTWKAVKGDETTTIECRSFYNGVETYFKTEVRGKVVVENKLLLGYDKKTDKLLECSIGSDDDDIVVYVAWFTSPNRMEEVLLEDAANPDKAKHKDIFEFISRDTFTLTTLDNNKPSDILTFHRIK